MKDFRTYSPEDIITSNLRETEERQDTVCEQTLAHLRELAAELLQENDLAELLHTLPEHSPAGSPPKQEIPTGNTERLSRLRPQFRLCRSLMLCREMRQMLNERSVVSAADFFSDSEDSNDLASTIVYQRSGYTDSAYLRLSPLLPDARAAYTHSFLSACEEVYNGHFAYCILPLENSTEGQLSSFLRLIRQYDLKIVATCDIAGTDAERVTRFALLRKSMLPLLSEDTACSRFDLSIPSYAFDSIADVLEAARFCGLRLYSIHSLPSAEKYGEGSVHLSLQTENADLQTFFFYLFMEAQHFTPIGLYPHLTQKGR